MELNRRLIVRTAAFCLLIVGVCYANSIHNDFILDDFLIVASNPDIRTITPVHFLLSPFWGEKGPAGIYRPLVILSFSIEYSIWHRWRQASAWATCCYMPSTAFSYFCWRAA